MTFELTQDNLKIREQKVTEGLKFTITHFDPPIWPRWVYTYVNHGFGKERKFRLVNNDQEALALYKSAQFLDCGIRAYSENATIPSLSLVDHDREHFETHEELELEVVRTRTNFEKILGGSPTTMWTGNGYHTIQPQSAVALENEPMFAGFYKPSQNFLRFEEELFSDGNADSVHISNLSFGNCYLRVPSSLNSNQVTFDKNHIINILPEAEVRITHNWDGYKPPTNMLYSQYYVWQKSVDAKILDRQIEAINYNKKQFYKNKYNWIERLLNKPLDNFRKYCITFVFVPYYINIKGMSEEEAFEHIKLWIDRSSFLEELDFNAEKRIRRDISRVKKFTPFPPEKIK